MPVVGLSAVKEGDFKLLVKGWDTVVETYDLVIPELLQERLEAARLAAEENETQGNPAPQLIQFGGEDIQINSRRPKGGKWVLQNDDFQITFRSPKMSWQTTVRYSAGGLWEYGLNALRLRVWELLIKECRPVGDDCKRISEAHWCWDFCSSLFSEDMRPGIMEAVVCHSSTKKRTHTKQKEIDVDEIGVGAKVETLTIGSRKSEVQVQVYDKGKEIQEASGKTWMLDLWARSGWRKEKPGMVENVWRLEIRMKKKFLRNRKILRMEEMRADLAILLAEVLYTRRLTSPSDDQNRARWPLHPLWTEAYQATSQAREMLPLGRQVTLTGDAIQHGMLKNIAGTVLAASVLEVGAYDPADVERLLNEAGKMLAADPELSRKEARKVEQYRYVNTAKG